MNANLGVQKNFTAYPPGPPTGTADGLAISQYNAPAQTVMLFEVQSSSDPNAKYDVSLNDPNNAMADNFKTNNGESPSGYGTGADYDPSGDGTQPQATAASNGLKYATGYFPPTNNVVIPNSKNFAAPTGRHTDGANYLMADTHAKFLRSSAVSAGHIAPYTNDCAINNGYNAAGTGCATYAATFNPD